MVRLCLERSPSSGDEDRFEGAKHEVKTFGSF